MRTRRPDRRRGPRPRRVRAQARASRPAHLDRLAERHIRVGRRRCRRSRATRAQSASNPFPASLCISIDDEVVHGIPGERDDPRRPDRVGRRRRDRRRLARRRRADLLRRRRRRPEVARARSTRPALAMMAGHRRRACRATTSSDISAAVEDVADAAAATASSASSSATASAPRCTRSRRSRTTAPASAGCKLEPGHLPRDRADVHPRRPRGRDQARRLDRRHPRRLAGRPFRAHHRRSPTNGPEILTTV